MIETVEFTGFEVAETAKGKQYHRFTHSGGSGKYFVWDTKVSRAIQDHLGTAVQVDVERKDDGKGGTFPPSVKSFHGVAVPATFHGPAAAGASTGPIPPAAPPVGSPGDVPTAGGSQSAPSGAAPSSRTFQKDPVGLVTSLRQTSLNAAVALMASDQGATKQVMPSEVVDTAKVFFSYLVSGLGKHIVRDGLTKTEVFFGEGDGNSDP